MNERIKELALQAGINSPDGFKLTVNHMATFRLEKFAALVEAAARAEMTPWFPPHIKPVHKGVYEVKLTAVSGYHRMYATWNGLKWSCSSPYASGDWHKKFRDADQDKYWRGFTKEQT